MAFSRLAQIKLLKSTLSHSCTGCSCACGRPESVLGRMRKCAPGTWAGWESSCSRLGSRDENCWDEVVGEIQTSSGLGTLPVIPTEHRSSLITSVTSKNAASLSGFSFSVEDMLQSNSEWIIVTFHTLS